MAGAARKAGLITLNVEVRTPRDKTEEELIIISANKQRKKTPEQEMKEVTRLRAIYEGEGLQRKSEARRQGWNKYREQKVDFSKLEKSTTGTIEAPLAIKENLRADEESQPIEDIYNELMERTAETESQVQNSAVEYIHLFTPNNV